MSAYEYPKTIYINHSVEVKLPKRVELPIENATEKLDLSTGNLKGFSKNIGLLIEEVAGKLNLFINYLTGLSPEEANKYWTDFVGNL